jgi:hypothetical protein
VLPVLPAAAALPASRLLQDGLVILIEDVMEDDDASAPSSPLRPATASGVDIFLVHPSAPSLSPSLSPFAPLPP